MRAGNFDVQIGITDRGANLVPASTGSEHAVGAGHRDQPFFRQARGHFHHVLLGNPHAEHSILALGMLGLEIRDLDRAGDVRMHGHHAFIGAGRFQPAPKAHARGVHVHFHRGAGIPPVITPELRQPGHALGRRRFGRKSGLVASMAACRSVGTDGVARSTMAFSNFSRSGAMPCQPAWFSMKETPFPFTVWASNNGGARRQWRQRAQRPTKMSPMSCPSISRTFHPKAAYFSARGSTSITSRTRPSICKSFLSMIPHRLSSL